MNSGMGNVKDYLESPALRIAIVESAESLPKAVVAQVHSMSQYTVSIQARKLFGNMIILVKENFALLVISVSALKVSFQEGSVAGLKK